MVALIAERLTRTFVVETVSPDPDGDGLRRLAGEEGEMGSDWLPFGIRMKSVLSNAVPSAVAYSP